MQLQIPVFGSLAMNSILKTWKQGGGHTRLNSNFIFRRLILVHSTENVLWEYGPWVKRKLNFKMRDTLLRDF